MRGECDASRTWIETAEEYKKKKNISGKNQGITCKIHILFSTIKWRICKRHSALLCRTANLGVQFINLFLKCWITQVQSRRAWFVCQNYIINSHPWNWINICNIQKAWQIFHCLCIPGRPFLKQPTVLLEDGQTWTRIWFYTSPFLTKNNPIR